MSVKSEHPCITRVIYNQDHSDPDYGSCLWAIFDFDPGRGMLSIQSDCGNYAYHWPERNQNFWNLMISMDKDYLIRKLCGKPNVFDMERTLANAREYLKEMECDEQDAADAVAALDDLLYENAGSGSSPDLVGMLLMQWNDEQELGLDCPWELAAVKYDPCQLRIVDIFVGKIVPELVRIELVIHKYHKTEEKIMTRGTLLLFYPETVISTTEFNGDMYGKLDGYAGKGLVALALMLFVETPEDLISAAETINQRFGYPVDEVKMTYDLTKEFSYESLLDMGEDYFKKYFSDYLYIKNKSGRDLIFRLRSGGRALLPDNKAGVLNFGDLADEGMFPKEMDAMTSVKTVEG